jgi:hypothetical protein
MSSLRLTMLVALVLSACTPVDDSTEVKDDTEDGSTGESGTDGSSDGDGSGGDGSDGGAGDGGESGDAPPDPEADCQDGVDNDEDGLMDCEDDDCADVAPCWWPSSMRHDGVFDFDGFEVTCETWIGDFDETVPDCQTTYTSTLTEVTDPALQCPTCDRTFYGALSYTADTCGDLTGGDNPTEAYFGFVFTSPTEWTLYGDDGSGGWEAGVPLTVSGADYSFAHTEPLYYDSGECDNDPLHIGNLTITWAFTQE